MSEKQRRSLPSIYAALPVSVRQVSPRYRCPCLSACGKFLRNRAPCAARSACASMRPLVVYIYAVGSQSCAIRRERLRCARLRRRNLPRMAPRVFVAPRPASRPLHSSQLPAPSRRFALRCFVGRIRPPRLAARSTAQSPNRFSACRSARHSTPRARSSFTFCSVG